MRFVTPLRSFPKWLFRFVFCKKFLLTITTIFVVCVATICLIHHFYNKQAWQHWDEVNTKATKIYQLDQPNRFHRVAVEDDFFEDPFVKEYLKLAETEEGSPLKQVQYMDLLGTGELTDNWGEKDVRKWIPGKEFETEKEAATYILTLLKPFEKYSTGFERLIYEKPNADSGMNLVVTLEGFSNSFQRKTFELVSLSSFFHSRCKLALHAEDYSTATRDLNHCMQLAKICEEDSSLVGILIHHALLASYYDILAFGIKHHAWGHETLTSAQLTHQSTPLIESFKEFPASEFILMRRFIELVQKHGYEEVATVLAGEYAKAIAPLQKALEDIFVENDNFTVDVEELGEHLLNLLTPRDYPIESAAITHEFLLDAVTPELAKPVHIEVLKGIIDSTPEYAWYEKQGVTHALVHTRQYISLTNAIARQRISWVACELEKHYIVHQEYPSSLNVLNIQDSVLLRDPFSSELLQYIPSEKGDSFELFSTGLSEEMLKLIGKRQVYDEEDEKIRCFHKH